MKELRKLNGIRQEDLAQYCGVSQQIISNVENKRQYPRAKLARKIGEFFSLSVDEIWDMFYSD